MMRGRIESTREEDLIVLEALHLRENEGMSVNAVAAEIGMTKGQISGLLHRVRVAHQPGAEHMDGTMPPRWWDNA